MKAIKRSVLGIFGIYGLLILSIFQANLVFAENLNNKPEKVKLAVAKEEKEEEKAVGKKLELERKEKVKSLETLEKEQNFKIVMRNLQKAIVNNNDIIFVTISEKELSRFIFSGDKIKHIYASSGELSYDISEENLYLKPNIIKPINFFVNTEKGKIYQVLAEPRDIPATQVMVLEAKAGNSGNKKTLNKASLVYDNMSSDSVLMKNLRKIILAIKSNDRTLGFKIKNIDKKIKEKSKKGGVISYLESRWSNAYIIAEKYHLENITDENIALNKANYLAEDVIAVYLGKPVIAPSENVLLILLKIAR